MAGPRKSRQPAAVVSCLSVREPHASAIFTDDLGSRKWAENRSRRTNYRGPLAIHVPATRDPGADRSRPTSAIIGFVDLVACLEDDLCDLFSARLDAANGRPVPDSVPPELRFITELPTDTWDHVCGPWIWVLANPRPLPEPILSVSGQLGIFKRTLTLPPAFGTILAPTSRS